MDLTYLISAFLTLGVYTTLVCFFFYKLNEKAIDKNEVHWREMFMYMNSRIDSSKDLKETKPN